MIKNKQTKPLSDFRSSITSKLESKSNHSLLTILACRAHQGVTVLKQMLLMEERLRLDLKRRK